MMSHAAEKEVPTQDIAEALGVAHEKFLNKLEELMIAGICHGTSVDEVTEAQLEHVNFVITSSTKCKEIYKKYALDFFKDTAIATGGSDVAARIASVENRLKTCLDAAIDQEIQNLLRLNSIQRRVATVAAAPTAALFAPGTGAARVGAGAGAGADVVAAAAAAADSPPTGR